MVCSSALFTPGGVRSTHTPGVNTGAVLGRSPVSEQTTGETLPVPSMAPPFATVLLPPVACPPLPLAGLPMPPSEMAPDKPLQQADPIDVDRTDSFADVSSVRPSVRRKGALSTHSRQHTCLQVT